MQQNILVQMYASEQYLLASYLKIRTSSTSKVTSRKAQPLSGQIQNIPCGHFLERHYMFLAPRPSTFTKEFHTGKMSILSGQSARILLDSLAISCIFFFCCGRFFGKKNSEGTRTLLSCWSKFFKKRQHSSKGIASASSRSNDTRAVARSLPDFLGERTREEGTEETLGNSRSKNNNNNNNNKNLRRTKIRIRIRSEHHGRSVNSGKRGDGLISRRSRAESSSGSSREDGETLVTEVHLERVLPQLLLDFTS